MPTYDYRCLACEHKFEAFQKMSEEPLKECPVCHGEVKRLFGGGAGFLFKGSGFYTTDYRTADYKSQAKSEKDGSSSPKSAEKSSEKSSEKASEKSSEKPTGKSSEKSSESKPGSKSESAA